MTGAQVLQHFSWGRYCIAAAIYTFVVFLGRSNGLGPVLAGRSSAGFSAIARLHLLFLAVLLALLWAVSAFYPTFPSWMTTPRISRNSGLDMILITALFVMMIVERRWIWALAAEPEGDTP